MAADPKFFAPGGTQERGDYDVALFAWAGSGQITSGQNIYATEQAAELRQVLQQGS